MPRRGLHGPRCLDEATLYVQEIEPFWAVGPSPLNGHLVGELQSKRRIR